MNADVLAIHVVDGIAVMTLGSGRRISIDQETSESMPKPVIAAISGTCLAGAF
jgi:enoyl-CoA hydratase/carnithine racemase